MEGLEANFKQYEHLTEDELKEVSARTSPLAVAFWAHVDRSVGDLEEPSIKSSQVSTIASSNFKSVDDFFCARTPRQSGNVGQCPLSRL